MCFYSKKVKEKALRTSHYQLKNEFNNCEQRCKEYDFSGRYKELKLELKQHKFLEKAMLYQHTKNYEKKMR